MPITQLENTKFIAANRVGEALKNQIQNGLTNTMHKQNLENSEKYLLNAYWEVNNQLIHIL